MSLERFNTCLGLLKYKKTYYFSVWLGRLMTLVLYPWTRLPLPTSIRKINLTFPGQGLKLFQTLEHLPVWWTPELCHTWSSNVKRNPWKKLCVQRLIGWLAFQYGREVVSLQVQILDSFYLGLVLALWNSRLLPISVLGLKSCVKRIKPLRTLLASTNLKAKNVIRWHLGPIVKLSQHQNWKDSYYTAWWLQLPTVDRTLESH